MTQGGGGPRIDNALLIAIRSLDPLSLEMGLAQYVLRRVDHWVRREDLQSKVNVGGMTPLVVVYCSCPFSCSWYQQRQQRTRLRKGSPALGKPRPWCPVPIVFV